MIGQLGKTTFNGLKTLKKRCNDAKSKVREKKDEFGNEYFYIFGLNKKFCDGIDTWKRNETVSANTSQIIMKLIMEWKSYK